MQNVERQKIIDYVAKVKEERGAPPSAREINRIVGNNNHGYLYESFESIDDACNAAGLERIGNRSFKTQAATLARKRQYQQQATIDLRPPEQVVEEVEEDDENFPQGRFLGCTSCGQTLHWDEDNHLICPTCRAYVICPHGEIFLFSRIVDLARAECGCGFYTYDRPNRAMDSLCYDLVDNTFKPYPPGKPEGYFVLDNENRIPL
ncbi:MAG: hypothetical protein O7B30_00870 [Thaumarchaeota archaeon]|nr:hypothetical protein [Nitrososphaerota archaeon]